MVAMTVLEEIQRLQYTDREAAHDLLRTFIRDVFGLNVAEVALRPLAVSLNSFNGFLTLTDGRRLFFKSHVEPGSVIAEYYNSDLLERAGYAIVRPVYASTTPGQQMLIYEVVDDRSVFDVAWAIERGRAGPDTLAALRDAQHAADDALWQVYQATLDWQDASLHASAPIHQLFHHRLTRGRLDEFYGPGTLIMLPSIGTVLVEAVRCARWTINGVPYRESLDDIIARAESLLEPEQAGPAVVGHGDAHNGNVFMREYEEQPPTLVYFDPAFAGRHDPLLDLVKPLYHNVFAMWMYFPGELAAERDAALGLSGSRFEVRYPPALHPVRRMFLVSKTERVLLPLLRALKARGWLRQDWRLYLRSALACCPLLTMNLADGARFPPEIALLGLAHVVEMGAQSEGGAGHVEQWLDDVESAL
jgi:hypothetical protein